MFRLSNFKQKLIYMNRNLILVIVLLITSINYAQLPFYVSTNNLVGWWPFNGNANDESGNGNNGTVNGAVMATDRFGNSNNSFSFDGIDDFIEIDINTTLPIGLSISVWISSNLPNSQFEHKGIVWSRLSGPSPNPPYPANQATGIMIHPNGILCTASDGNSIVQIQDTGQYYNDASWYHLVFTYEANSGFSKIFVNGIETKSIQSLNLSPIDLAYNTIKIGKDEITGYGNRHWNGLIDDIGIWNRALTACEIKNLYNGGVPNSSQTQTALDTYTWPVNNQTYTQSGTYSDTLVNAAGCDSIVTLNLTLSYTGINELNASQLVVSPNPTKDNFSISGLELLGTITSLEIKDAAGKVVKVLDPTATNFSSVGLKAGVYFLAVTSNKTERVIKIIKE
ncbi:MAG: Internalin-J precursor [Bacteroidota bacterium]|jgi:hypothetical protein